MKSNLKRLYCSYANSLHVNNMYKRKSFISIDEIEKQNKLLFPGLNWLNQQHNSNIIRFQVYRWRSTTSMFYGFTTMLWRRTVEIQEKETICYQLCSEVGRFEQIKLNKNGEYTHNQNDSKQSHFRTAYMMRADWMAS